MQTATFSGDPVEDMEVAKRLIAKHPDVDLENLITIASDRSQRVSSRVAAIYTLCFADDEGRSSGALSRIVNSAEEPDDVKDHAVEALDAMPD